MLQFDLPKQKSSILKVLGVGGGGSNAVNFMFAQDIENVDFIICNTDAKALEQSKIPNKIQLGPHLTQGLGAGANPEVGKQATEESLDEIRRILEVNTKMAFITAGMGGGTGTGGAPIIAKICRDLGVLTVGIVTTPFGFEGPRRLKQAEEGIRQLQPYVDTLLVISNDKLRQQYGNLKMTAAFSKADNVLATAAKCITDIINSRGTIIVDFADVCTVMKNGGVAILGSATAEGEDRAQKAIEEALNSPLLNDSDIRGAKWILVNINSGDGEHECTMDEFEIINNYLRSQSGDNSDLIIGTGYDETLGNKIGITLIATGFEYKDPFVEREKIAVETPIAEQRIIMTLGVDGDEKKMFDKKQEPAEEKNPYAPTLVDPEPEFEEQKETNIPVVIKPEPEPERVHIPVFVSFPKQTQENIPTSFKEEEEEEMIRFHLGPDPEPDKNKKEDHPKPEQQKKPEPVAEHLVIRYSEKESKNTNGAQNGSFLSKPAKIYAEIPVPPAQPEKNEEAKKQKEEVKIKIKPEIPEEETFDFKIVVRDEQDATPPVNGELSFNTVNNEEEDQKKKAAERLAKLRNLSFNMNASEANGEYDNVPAYVRRNMELFGNTLTSVEKFYSKYTVKKDENNETQISSINTFLDGKKPD